MQLLFLISNRLTKLLGNISKMVIGYPFHFLLPNKRFTIPKYSKAIIKKNNNHQIPKLIWQTNYTNKVSLPVYLNYLFNRLMSLDYDYHYVSTQDILEFVNAYASIDIAKSYGRLNDGAAQADFWRLLVLQCFGGVYMDIDAHLIFPLSKIIKKNDKELFIVKKGMYTNYFMAFEKNHYAIQAAILNVADNINNNKVKSVFSLTGPVPFDIALKNQTNKINTKSYRYVCIQGSFTNEYFQYIDKPKGKWIHTKPEEILKP